MLHNTPQRPPRMSTLQGCAAFQVLQGSRAGVAALTAHISGLIPLIAFDLEGPGDSRDHWVLGNHLFVFLWPHQGMEAGMGTHGLTDQGLRHPATTSPAIFVSLSLTHKPSTGSQCSAASHCVYESTVQYFMTWAEVISPLQLGCLAGLSHLPAWGPAGCRVTNGKDALG